MTYDEAISYLEGLGKLGIRPGLEGVKLLAQETEALTPDIKYIHVVGTNGKGSTSLFIAEILRAAGHKVGLYSSPAVFSEREIISVNGRDISKADFAGMAEAVSRKNTFGCTRFEVETVMAFLYFKMKGCDIAIIEAGMGGGLDATNITTESLATVFTSIGMDHTRFLGDTIEKIAATKAGIIKKGSIVITTEQERDVKKVIDCTADSMGAKVIYSLPSKASAIKYRKTGTCFNYADLRDIKINLMGTFQVTNACLAIDAVRALTDADISVSAKQILKGLEHAKESGRFEKICDKPVFFIDGAHNEPASLRLRETIQTYFTKNRIIYIMGMLRDKDVETVVKNTVDLADCIFTVATPNTKRTMSAYELAEVVQKYNHMVTSMDSVEEAVEMAIQMAGTEKDVVILGFGSLSHLGKIKLAVRSKKK